VRGRSVFVSPRGQELIWFDHSTSDSQGRYRPAQGTLLGEVASTSRVFFAHSRELTAYGATSDSYAPAWNFTAQSRILVGPLVEGGAVFIGDDRGFLYRLEANDK